jgi:threonine aldolase
LLLQDLEQSLVDPPDDPQFALPALICLENTHNRCGGTILPLEYLARIAQFARARDLPIHLDGARIFNAAVASDTNPAQIASYADSVQFCLSKGLAAPIGSIVLGDINYIHKVRRIRKMLGGGMRQAGIIAAAGIIALEQMIDRLREDHQNAYRLADGLASLPGIEVDLSTVQTNIVIFRVVDERFNWQSFLVSVSRRLLSLGELGHGRIRAVLHYGITEQDVDHALEIISDVLRHGP